MMTSGSLSVGSLSAALLLLSAQAGLVAAEIAAASGPDSQQAVWVLKERHFVYQGFTTRYSCEGLADKIRKALLQLGARKDLEVREGACTRPGGGPEPFPNVDVRMHVLETPTASNAGHRTLVPAHWKTVEVRLDRDPLSEAGDCELVEQIKQSLLPLFATRTIDYRSSCIPHQLQPGGTWLKAEVLISDRPDAKGAAPREP